MLVPAARAGLLWLRTLPPPRRTDVGRQRHCFSASFLCQYLPAFQKATTSQQTFTDTGSQTQSPKTCSVGTQLSIKTLQPHVRSTGTQTTLHYTGIW
ncbi:uncharacterized protein LOC133554362 isoform X7 [Nerophis ophidion]|uniref:uncharacterized protein LOC133554362 isoform X7 n=1 Tax=Nerophis ophidion TaxID=159077 RepID=UPI002ADF08AC|nr:uncharacterized protein LOC133554362 isoform X7 [Nerophis ophidion]